MIKLGDEVKCKVSGFRGIVTSVTNFLNGCVQVGIQAPVTKDGKFGESWSIDVSQLVVVNAGKVVIKKQDVGGPPRRIL